MGSIKPLKYPKLLELHSASMQQRENRSRKKKIRAFEMVFHEILILKKESRRSDLDNILEVLGERLGELRESDAVAANLN